MISNSDIVIMSDKKFENEFQEIYVNRKQVRPIIMTLYEIDSLFDGPIREMIYKQIFLDEKNESQFVFDCLKLFENNEIIQEIENYLKNNYKDVNIGSKLICQGKTNFFKTKIPDPIFKRNLINFCIMNELRNLGVFSVDTINHTITKNVTHFPMITANFLAKKCNILTTYKIVNNVLNNEILNNLVTKKIEKTLSGKGKKQYSIYALTDFGREICKKIKDESTLYGRLYHIETQLLNFNHEIDKIFDIIKGSKSSIRRTCIKIDRMTSNKNENLLDRFDLITNKILLDDLLTQNLTCNEFIKKAEESGLYKNIKNSKSLLESRYYIEYYKVIYGYLKNYINILQTELGEIKENIEIEFDLIEQKNFENIDESFINERDRYLNQISSDISEFLRDEGKFKDLEEILLLKIKNNNKDTIYSNEQMYSAMIHHEEYFLKFSLYFNEIKKYFQ